MIDKLDVFLNMYKKELLVGQLAYMDKKIYFEYDKSFLTTGIDKGGLNREWNSWI